ncbi:MAG: RICIN domain-containing protein [Coprococcus sp.]
MEVCIHLPEQCGYYKIKNAASGRYLGVSDQQICPQEAMWSEPGLHGGTRWQVIPDGKEAIIWYPECSNTAAVDLTNGTVANGTNIRIWNYNLTGRTAMEAGEHDNKYGGAEDRRSRPNQRQ